MNENPEGNSSPDLAPQALDSAPNTPTITPEIPVQDSTAPMQPEEAPNTAAESAPTIKTIPNNPELSAARKDAIKSAFNAELDTAPVDTNTGITPATPETAAAAKVPKQKSKAGMIIGVILALVTIGCGIAALIIFNPFGSPDPVSAAITKLLRGEMPSNIEFSGDFSVSRDAKSSLSSTSKSAKKESISADISGEYSLLAKSGAISMDADINTAGTGELNVDADVILAADGDAFIKINDLDGDNPAIKAAASVMSDSWLRASNAIDMLDDTPVQCFVDLAEEMKSGKFLDLYNKNPFISSTTEGVSIAQKSSTVYKLVFDNEKLGNFTKEILGSQSSSKILSCMGSEASLLSGASLVPDSLFVETAKEITDWLPPIYVEVDKDNNFSRLYIDSSTDKAAIKFDISLTYPSSITVEEPREYEDFNLFGGSDDTLIDGDLEDDSDIDSDFDFGFTFDFDWDLLKPGKNDSGNNNSHSNGGSGSDSGDGLTLEDLGIDPSDLGGLDLDDLDFDLEGLDPSILNQALDEAANSEDLTEEEFEMLRMILGL